MTKLDRLVSVYKEHGTIIVGVDFDDTIFPYNDYTSKSECALLRRVLKSLKPHITICLYTVADEASLKYKVALMEEWGISPDYINESPLKMPSIKPYFNILLDDKAGLEQTTKTMKGLLIKLKQL